MEILKQQIASTIKSHRDKNDFIDIASARLAMRTVIAEEGVILKGEDTLAWSHYLSQTWAELEEYYWKKVMRLELYHAEYVRIASLEQQGEISLQQLQQWNSTIGLRNRIVHDYMNIEMDLIYDLLTEDNPQFIANFLCKPIPSNQDTD
jgi:hypothetical protein